MKLKGLIFVAGTILSFQVIIGEATLSMLMGSMRSNQRYGTSNGNGYSVGNYGSLSATTTKAPTLGSIIGSAIDGLQTLKGMVMTPVMDMAANLLMMASNGGTTAAPATTPAPVPPMTYAAYPSPYYGTIAPAAMYPAADMYANGYSGYYTSGSSNYVSGTGSPSSYGQDYTSAYYSSKKDNEEQSVDDDIKYNSKSGGSTSSSSTSSLSSNKVKRFSRDVSSSNIRYNLFEPSVKRLASEMSRRGSSVMNRIKGGIRWLKSKGPSRLLK